jgi:hypothetical protein
LKMRLSGSAQFHATPGKQGFLRQTGPKIACTEITAKAR